MHMSFFLPEEILTLILEKLPVKSLLRCMCVNKSWFYFIQSPMFVTAHSNYQKIHHTYLLFTPRPGINPLTFSLRVDDAQREEYILLKSPPCFRPFKDPLLHGVSNGLICLSYSKFEVGYDSKVCLWNPATQKFKSLPEPPRWNIPGSTPVISCVFCPKTNDFEAVKIAKYDHWISCVGLAFGFCPKANDFKVVKIVRYCWDDTDFIVADVYCLASNSWKMIDDLTAATFIWYHDSVFLNGTAYFRGMDNYKGDVIICYDTDKDTVRVISFPEIETFPRVDKSVHVFGESVAVFLRSCLNGLNMWLLAESATTELCWEKKISLSFDVPSPRILETLMFDVLGIRTNNEVLIQKSSYPEDENEDVVDEEVYEELVSYNVEKDEEKNFGWNEPPFCISCFAESLVIIDT